MGATNVDIDDDEQSCSTVDSEEFAQLQIIVNFSKQLCSIEGNPILKNQIDKSIHVK